jgi:iron complex outermembrane receptor protein
VRASSGAVFLLALFPLGSARAEPPEGGRKVSGKELMKTGFFQDFAEISLEDLLEPQGTRVEVASARPVAPELAPGAVSVYKAEDIRNLGARSLGDLLRLVPGFDVTIDNLGRSRLTVRGIGSSRAQGGSDLVLILLDGVRLNEEVVGGATLVNLDLPLDHARQVEVLRGAASALYGDAAVAAVINIVSQTTDDFMGSEAGIGLGSYWTQTYALRSAGVLGKVKISGYLRFGKTDGAQRRIPADAQTIADEERALSGLPPISLAPGPATDGRKSLDASYAFAYHEWSFAFRSKSEQSDGFVGAADALGRQNDLNNNQLSLDLGYTRSFKRLGAFRTRATFARSEIRDLLEIYPSGYQLTGAFGSLTFGVPGGDGGVFLQDSINERRFELTAAVDPEIGEQHRLSLGAGLRYTTTFDLEANANLDLRNLTPVVASDEGSSLAPLPGAVTDRSRTTASLQAEDVWRASDRLSVTGSLRFDHLSDVGGTLSPRLALVGSLPAPGLGFKLLYGRAFRAPTFRELAFNLPGGRGNPDLVPVKADELELALSFARQRTRLEAHPFLNFVRDLIVPTGNPTGDLEVGITTPFVNRPRLKTAGVELLARQGVGVDDSLFFNYTYQDATDRTTGEKAPGIPSHLLNLGATFHLDGRFSATPILTVRGGRPRIAGDPRPPVDAYAVFSLSVRARNLWRTLEVVAAAENLFGKDYRDPSPLAGVPGDYPRPGARVLVHASLRF